MFLTIIYELFIRKMFVLFYGTFSCFFFYLREFILVRHNINDSNKKKIKFL